MTLFYGMFLRNDTVIPGDILCLFLQKQIGGNGQTDTLCKDFG